MEYIFTDSDKRTYTRSSSSAITIESSILSDGHIEISLSDSRSTFIVLRLNNREAAAISCAANAGLSKCNSSIIVPDDPE